jgi:hypothetical protein
LEALSEIPSFSKFVLTIDMQLDLTDCEEDVFFPFLEFSINFFCVLKVLDSLSTFPLLGSPDLDLFATSLNTVI